MCNHKHIYRKVSFVKLHNLFLLDSLFSTVGVTLLKQQIFHCETGALLFSCSTGFNTYLRSRYGWCVLFCSLQHDEKKNNAAFHQPGASRSISIWLISSQLYPPRSCMISSPSPSPSVNHKMAPSWHHLENYHDTNMSLLLLYSSKTPHESCALNSNTLQTASDSKAPSSTLSLISQWFSCVCSGPPVILSIFEKLQEGEKTLLLFPRLLSVICDAYK